MTHRLLLPYGRSPIEVVFPVEPAVCDLPAGGPARSLAALLRGALEAPIGAPRLRDMAGAGDRVLVIVSDSTRDDPRRALLEAVLDELPAGTRVRVAVASGTHAPLARKSAARELDLGPRARDLDVVVHDADDDRALVAIGRTSRGVEVRVNRCAIDTDIIVSTGRIKPHYFAGFGAGAKGLFPGLGGKREIRENHALKTDPRARAGVVDDNPCRAELEETLDLIGRPTYLLNAVCDADGGPQLAVAGDVRAAFRVGARAAREWFLVRAPASRAVVVSDALPLAGSLYQASKLAAAAAALVEPGGTIVIAAECPYGIGPVKVVNEAIYEIGIAPRLPEAHRVLLVSGLPRAQVERSYCEWAPSVEAALEGIAARPTVLPRAGAAIVERIEGAVDA